MIKSTKFILVLFRFLRDVANILIKAIRAEHIGGDTIQRGMATLFFSAPRLCSYSLTDTAQADTSAPLPSAHTVAFGKQQFAAGRMTHWSVQQLTRVLPEGLGSSKSLADCVKRREGSLSLLVRPVWGELFQHVEKALGAAGTIVIDGKRGSGKSATLAALVAAARADGWFVVYLDAEKMTVSFGFFVVFLGPFFFNVLLVVVLGRRACSPQSHERRFVGSARDKPGSMRTHSQC